MVAEWWINGGLMLEYGVELCDKSMIYSGKFFS